MKYFIIPLILTMFLISCQNGCGNMQNTNANDPGSQEQTQQTDNSGTPSPTEPGELRGATAQEQRVFDMYTRDYWVVTGFHKIGDKPAFKRNRGRWYQFNPNGTFTVGHFDKVLSKGNWRLEQQASHMRLDAENDEEDGLWRMQVRSDESMLVWVGTEEAQSNSIQQRLENLLFAPKSPKEMGWDN